MRIMVRENPALSSLDAIRFSNQIHSRLIFMTFSSWQTI